MKRQMTNILASLVVGLIPILHVHAADGDDQQAQPEQLNITNLPGPLAAAANPNLSFGINGFLGVNDSSGFLNTANGIARLRFEIPSFDGPSVIPSQPIRVDLIAIPMPELEGITVAIAARFREQVLGSTILDLEQDLNSTYAAANGGTQRLAIRLGPRVRQLVDWWIDNPVATALRRPLRPRAAANSEYPMTTGHLVLAVVRGGAHVAVQYTLVQAPINAALTIGGMSAFFGITYEQVGSLVLHKGFVPMSWLDALANLPERLNRLRGKAHRTPLEDIERVRLEGIVENSAYISERDGVAAPQRSLATWFRNEFGLHSGSISPTGERRPVILESVIGGLYKFWLIEVGAFMLPAVVVEKGWGYFLTDPASAAAGLVIGGVVAVWFQFFADFGNYQYSRVARENIMRVDVPEGRDPAEYRKALRDGHRFMSTLRGMAISLFSVSYATMVAKSVDVETMTFDTQSLAILGVSGLVGGAVGLHYKYGGLLGALRRTYDGLSRALRRSFGLPQRATHTIRSTFASTEFRGALAPLFEGTNFTFEPNAFNVNLVADFGSLPGSDECGLIYFTPHAR